MKLFLGSLSCTRHSLQYISQSTGDLVDPKSLYYGAIYEVEVWLKYTGAKGTVRRKLDLVAKCHPKKESVDQGLRNLFYVYESKSHHIKGG